MATETTYFEDPQGPIESLSWGAFVVRGKTHAGKGEDREGKGKDIRLVGEKVTRWKERKGHELKKSMITGVYDENVEVLVIGNGANGRVEVPDKVKKDIAAHGIGELIVEKTPDACRVYNQLCRAGRKAALLAHGTC